MIKIIWKIYLFSGGIKNTKKQAATRGDLLTSNLLTNFEQLYKIIKIVSFLQTVFLQSLRILKMNSMFL